MIGFMEEQKMILDNTRQMQEILIKLKISQKMIEEANKGVAIEDLENMKKEMEQISEENIKEGENVIKNEEMPKENDKTKENEIKEINEKENQVLNNEELKKNEQDFKKGYDVLKEAILATIFVNEGFKSEDINNIYQRLDKIKQKHEEFNNYFAQYAEEDRLGLEEDLDALEKAMAEMDTTNKDGKA